MEVVDNTTDFEISSTFPRQPENVLEHLIDYGIKLLLKDDVFLEPGESQLLATTCRITRKCGDLCIHLKPSEKLPVTFESKGYICEGYCGRITIKLTNYSGEARTILAWSEAGYAILTPGVL